MADAAVLSTLQTGRGTEDLAPVRDALTRPRVVGLGEAVVGTRESALLAGRLLELLVVEGGVRVLALGAPEAPTVALDEYVVGTRDTASDALEALADWRWNTADVLRALDWVRTHNADAAPSELVRVVGVEPVTPAPAVTAVGTFLRVHDAALLDEVGETLLGLISHRAGDPPLPASVRAAAERVADRVRAVGPDGSAGSAGPVLEAHARAVARAARMATAPVAEVDTERERMVADAVLRAAGTENRVLWWGQAGSVRVRGSSAGALLREGLGRDYYALAVLLGEGEFRATRRRRVLRTSRVPTRHRLRPAPEGSVEAALVGNGNAVRVLDLGPGGLPGGATTMRALPDPLPLRWRRSIAPVADGELDGVAHVPRSREALVR